MVHCACLNWNVFFSEEDLFIYKKNVYRSPVNVYVNGRPERINKPTLVFV